MINDMDYHTLAWQSIMNEDFNLNLSFDEVKREMYGKNHEVLARIFGLNHFTNAEVEKLSTEKERRYREAYFPNLTLLPGLGDFLAQAKNTGIKMAVASAAIPYNIDFVLDGLQIRHYFDAIVSAHDVAISKPHPETFLKAADILGVMPNHCLVFEDAPKGVEAAINAGMNCFVLTTSHKAFEFEAYPNVLAYLDNYTDIRLQSLFNYA